MGATKQYCDFEFFFLFRLLAIFRMTHLHPHAPPLANQHSALICQRIVVDATPSPVAAGSHVQQELVRDSGLRAIRQAAGSRWSDVAGFLESKTFSVALKPTDSAGSDGVKLCHDMEEAEAHFHHLLEVEAVNGGFNTEVLCQEFLRGKKYSK